MTAGPATFDRLAQFGTLVTATGRGRFPLPLAAATMINAVLRPDVDVDDVARTLDEMALGCVVNTFDGVRAHVFDTLGFRAMPTGADDPRNSMIKDVLATRRGLPVLVATIMIGIGLRIRVPVTGIGMPYQFLIGDPRRKGVYVDPVTGAMWNATQSEQCFHHLAGGHGTWDDRYLRPVRKELIIERILRNLEATYRRQGDTMDLALVVSMMSRLPHMTHRTAEAKRLSSVFN